MELCNPFSLISNSFPRIGNSIPRIKQIRSLGLQCVPSNKTNPLPRNQGDELRLEKTDCLNRVNKLQSEKTNCLNQRNELIICWNGFAIRGNGLHNSI